MFSGECLHVQTHISLRCSRKNVLFLFQRPFVSLIICYKCRPLITFSNSLDPGQTRQNFLAKMARMWSPAWAFAPGEESFFYFLSAHFCFLLVPFFLQTSIQFCWNSCFSSVCSCKNAHMSLRCSRGFFLYIFGSSCPAPKINSYTMRHGEISYMQLNNAMFIYFKMCSICKFCTIIVENIYIRFQSLVT